LILDTKIIVLHPLVTYSVQIKKRESVEWNVGRGRGRIVGLGQEGESRASVGGTSEEEGSAGDQAEGRRSCQGCSEVRGFRSTSELQLSIMKSIG